MIFKGIIYISRSLNLLCSLFIYLFVIALIAAIFYSIFGSSSTGATNAQVKPRPAKVKVEPIVKKEISPEEVDMDWIPVSRPSMCLFTLFFSLGAYQANK